MNYKILGKTGLRVSEICLGTMTFGEEWGWGASWEESKKMFDCYAERGGNFLDTANRYTEGTSEKYVGDLIHSERDNFVLATKYTLHDKKGNPNFSGNHKKNMIRSLDASLKRLKTDYIDLFWLHVWDYTMDIEELMRAFDDLVRSGKVFHIGVSNMPAWMVSKANTIAGLRGWTPFSALQIEYSLIERTPERELLPMANEFSLTVTPWSPLGQGLLTGKYTDKSLEKEGRLKKESLRYTERGLSIAREVDKVAHVLKRPQAQVALNWIYQTLPSSIPIVGARTKAQLSQSLGCLDFEIPSDYMQQLTKVSSIELGYPHDFVSLPTVEDTVYGGTRDKIDF